MSSRLHVLWRAGKRGSPSVVFIVAGKDGCEPLKCSSCLFCFSSYPLCSEANLNGCTLIGILGVPKRSVPIQEHKTTSILLCFLRMNSLDDGVNDI